MDDFLVRMISHVEQQYSDIEKECLILKKLLKPWPKKPQVNTKTTEVVKQADEHEREENDSLTANEKLALEEMDRLLNKAQKTIKIREKVSVAERSNDSDSNKKDQDDSVNNIKDAQEKRDDAISSKKSEKVVTVGSKGNLVTKKKEVPIVKKNPLTRVSSGSGAAEVRSNQEVSSRLSSSRSVTPRSSSVTNSVSRPSSSRSRYTPAHVNAPFKTDVNTRVPNRKFNHVHKNQLNKASNKKNTKQKQPSHLNGLKTLPKIARAVQESNIDNIDSEFDDKETGMTADTDNSGGIQPIAASGCIPCLDEGMGMGDLEREDNVDDDSKVSSHEQNIVSKKVDQPCFNQDEFFSLRDKSSKIKVPQRLHKLVTENHTLLEKCSTAKLVKKMPNTDAAYNFVARLNERCEVSQELWAKAKALTCVQSHHLMLKSLSSLGIEGMSEATPFQAVYRAKKLLEFILTKFAQTQDETDYFSKVQFRPCQSSEMTSESDEKDITKYLFQNQETESPTLKNDQFVMDALTSSKEWTHLQFEKNLHQLLLHLLSLSESEWWQILCKDSTNGSIVQMIHSLLTSSGVLFPAIIENPYS